MNKEDLLQEKIENLLLDIDFICQYQNLSNLFPKSDPHFKYDSNQIIEISKEFGILLNVFNGDQYFSAFQRVEDSEFRIGLTIKYNFIEFDITIKNKFHNIRSGGSFGLLSQLLSHWKTRIDKPGFENYDQLRNLLCNGFKIYENIKDVVVLNLAQKI